MLKLCSRPIVLEVSIAFYDVHFVYFILLLFLTNHNFTVVYSCIVSRLFVSFANRVSEILASDSGDTLQLILIVQMM